jgi:peptide/nickel transport system substrate-binding protein
VRSPALNDYPRPLAWTKNAGEVIGKINRAKTKGKRPLEATGRDCLGHDGPRAPSGLRKVSRGARRTERKRDSVAATFALTTAWRSAYTHPQKYQPTACSIASSRLWRSVVAKILHHEAATGRAHLAFIRACKRNAREERVLNSIGSSSRLVIAAFVVCGLSVAACGGSSSSPSSSTSGTGTPPKNVTIRLTTDPNNLDFYTAEDAGNGNLAEAAYDRLVAFGPKGNYVPYLASSWKATLNSVTFTIKKGVTCSDGTPVTPTVVANSFKFLINVKKEVNNLPFAFGAGPYSVSANNAAGTFTFTTKTPYRNLLGGFALSTSSILCPAGIKNPGSLTTQMDGSGPYTLSLYRPDNEAVFKLRPNWNWGPLGVTAKNLPKQLTFVVIQNETTAATEMLTGSLQFAQVSGPDDARLLKSPNIKSFHLVNYAPRILDFNMYPGHATDDEALRHALMLAIDQNDLRNAISPYDGPLTPSVLLPGTECYDPETAKIFPNLNIATAKQVLAAGGYQLAGGKLMKNGQPVRISLLESAIHGQGGAYLQAQWAKLGITTNVEDQPLAPYGQNVFEGNFDVAFTNTTQASPDPGTRLVYWSGPNVKDGGANLANTGAGDPVLNNSLQQALSTTGAASCSAFSTVQLRYLQHYYIYPVSEYGALWFSQKGWHVFAGPRSFEIYSLANNLQ